MITCAINNIEIVKALYSDINGALIAAEKSKSEFDHVSYMKDLFKDLSKQGTPESAAKYLQSVPRLIIDAKNLYFENVKADLNNLQELNIRYKSDKGIQEVINDLSDKSNIGDKKANIDNVKNESINLNQDPEVIVPAVRLPERFKTLSPFGGSFQAYIKLNPNNRSKDPMIDIESINPELLYMIKTFDRIKNIQNNTDITNGILYDGVKLYFKGMLLTNYATPENLKFLDSDTQAQIAKSLRILKGKNAPKDVIQVNEIPILLLSDKDGVVIYFDENGNITTSDKGKPVYQFMRIVRKNNNVLSVKNIYNNEDALISPEDFAKDTYDPNIDGTEEEYLASVKKMMDKEMSDLFSLQNEIINWGATLTLPITGISNGIPSNLSSTKIYLNDLLKLPNIPSDIVKTIKTLPIDQGGYIAGTAQIEINGNKFVIERPLITEDLANEIATVLTNPKIPFEQKKKYTDQFLENLDFKRKTKKYNLFYDKKSGAIYFNIFENFESPKQTNDNIKLDSGALGKVSPETRDSYKDKIIQYLTKEGLPKYGNRTFITFNNPNLDSGTYMRLNADGNSFNNNADYYDFLSKTNSEINLKNADPGFYNYVLNFTSTTTELGKIINDDEVTSNSETERIISSALSDQYKSTVNQANPFDNYLITKYLSDEIKNNYYVDKSRDFLQSIFDNLISRNNNQYNISEKQKEFIQDLINKSKFLVKEVNENAKPPVEQDIIETVTVPGAESPEDNTIVNKIFDDENTDEDYSRYFDRANIKKEFISPIKIVEAKLWWNSKKMEPMRKLIDFGRMANIVNSDSYARFIVSGATLADTGTMGTILVNKQMGSVFQNLTIYHEAWHVFSQLFLTKKQKLDLYNELKNYTDKTGNKPYAKMSLINLEEMLAEDFRNYVKTGKAKTASPKRNTLFRQMVNFLKQLFGKILSKFKKQDIEINSLNSPMAKRLFNELYLGQFNNYTATTDNKLFYQLDRGPRQLEYPSQDALSPTDGLLVSKSIDGFFAEQLNNIYKKTGKTEIAISGITNPKARAELYKDALESFNQKLKLEKAKLKDSETDQIDFNSLDTLELIEANAVAIMEEKTGKNKYFFLTSQVSDFKNLAAATKKGERVRGEDYKETIRIVGDFYKHKTITKNGKLIDIVIISRPQDAKTQYANYKKAGADIFTNLIETPKVEKVYIEQDQEIVRDTVRILQTTIDNWGDEKSGIVKYHIENTDFEIAKKQYDIDEEEVAEDRPNELDAKTGTESLQQTLSKETIFVLKTLFKVNSDGTVPLNRLGFSELAEYGKTFAIVAKTIGGIRDRYEAYDKLKAESAKFPELKQLVETKIPNPRISGAETNTIAFNLSRQFFQDFGKPQIDYMQLYAFFETNDEGKESILNFQVKESDLAIDNVLGKWVTNFKSLRKNDFINVSPDNIRTLNLSKIVKEFKDSKSTKTSLDINKQIQFAKVLGIELQQNSNIEKELKEKPELYGLIYMFNYLDKINNLEILSTSEKLEKGQKLLLNKFKENPVETFRQGFSGKILGETGVIKELTQLKRLAELQTKYGYDASSTAVIRSNQTVGYKEVNWSSGHAKAYALNQVTEMQQLWNDPRYNYMSYLDPKLNTYTKHLKIISSLFNENGKKKANKSIKYFAQDGFSMTDLQGDSSGNITTELDPISKFIFEQHTMLLSGTAELPRTSDKKFSFGIKIEGGIDSNDINFDLTKGEDKNLYVDSKLFATNKGETYARLAYLYGYMQGEFDRIKLFRGENKDEYLNITGYNNEVNDVGEKLYSGQTFSAFKDILSEDTKKRLYALADQQLNVDLLTYVQTTDTKLGTDIKNDIQSYFNEKISDVKELYYDKLPYISRSLLEKIGIRKEDIDTNEKHKAVYTNNAIINTIIKSYVYNDWIHKFETSILLFGDYAQWDHGKEAWSKRIPGLTSDGIGFLYDANTVAFINNVFNKETYASLLEKKEGQEYNNYHFSEKLNSAVIEDPIRESIYVDEYEQMWRKDYEKTFSKEVAKEKAAKDAGVYDGITESDGIALVTLDAYRDLKKVGRGWGLAEEDLYKKIINGESVSDVSKVFSVYKLQYYGAIENNLLPVTGMYKFSVLPIIPGVNAIEGNELDKLHKKMLRQNVQLVTFSSGSKGAHLTSNGKTDNVFIDKESKYVNTEIITEGENQGEDVFKFTKNPIYLANLKEVTVMNDSFKGNLSIATQTRAIIIDNLFENGKLKNLNNFQTVQNYIESIKNYSEILKEDLLNGLGIELIDGRVIGDFTKFVEIIRNELTQRDIPAHLVKLINIDNKDKLAMDLSLHPESDYIEKLLVSLIQRGVVKQKTKGEALVQVPSTFTNGTWDTPYLDITDIKEIQKLLGSNTLPFYIVNGETRSEEMKVAIALQGDFKNLLNAKDLEGNKIETRERLNQLIKDPVWFSQNKKSLTLFGPRIPNDAHNTIEAATVWHFLPEAFGPSIITPTEIIAKAGSDYDGDKLFMQMPNIDVDGTYISKGITNFAKVLNDTKILERENKLPKNQMTSRQLITQQKKYLQNKYLESAVEILMLPENAVGLVKPNGTYLVDKYADNLQKYAKGYNKYKNVRGQESDTNSKNKKIPSPTRYVELLHNIFVHDANLSLEASLGILAKITKSIPLYKAAGAKMRSTYSLSEFLRAPLKMRFKKNTVVNKDGETVISLGGEKNVLGENISDTTSHSLQGILDRAKETFPFDLKLVPEAMDVYGYATRAGMDQESIVYLLNQPLVVKYLEEQKLNTASLFSLLGKKLTSSQLINKIANDALNQSFSEKQIKEDILPKINTNKVKAIFDSLADDLDVIISLPTETINIKSQDIKNNKNINNSLVTGIEVIIDNKNLNLFRKVNKDQLFYKNNAYFLIDILAKDVLQNEEEIPKESLINIVEKQDDKSKLALMIFLHFVELERQYSPYKDLETSFSPDTGSIITIQEAIIREKDYNRFMNSSEIDKEFIDNLKNNSVLSSLMFDELTVDILTPLFKTKLNPTIVSYISDTMSDTDAKADIIRKFGKGPDGRAKFIKAFGNNLITAIFQTYVSNFSNAKGTLVNIPESYETLPIEIDDTINTDVIIENDKIIINSRAIEFDFANKLFMSNNNTEDSYKNRGKDTFPTGKNPFNNLRSFYRYSIAKAYLESNNTIDSLSNDSYFLSLIAKNNNNVDTAYTEYISERALLNSFNPQYIMGTTKYSYTDNMMQLLQSLEDNTSLKDKFSILGQLSPQPNKNGFKIVRLNNRRDMQGLTAQDYYTQIRQLGDASIQKLDNPNNSPTIESKDKRISDLFSVFSLMMFYQHGIGRTSTGFNSALDSSQYKPIIIGSSPAFISNYVEVPNSTILDVISEKTFDPIKFKLFAGNRNEYLHKDIAALEKDEVVEVTEEFDLNEGSVIPITFTAGEKIIANTDIEVYKKYINKSNGVKPYKFFTPNTNFSKFYNGKQQTMPQTAIWLLTEDTGLYDMIDQSEDSGEVYYENVDLETGIQMLREGEGTTQPGVSQTNKPKGEEVKEGIYLNQGALTKEEQLELFNYLKPYLEEQANKSLKATQGSKMIGLGLRWDYTSNNPGKTAINIPDPIKRNPKYGYYNQSINGQALGQITQRFRELMEKATGVDMTNYDGAIINLYDNDSFISSHNDVDESRSAIKYPVIGINLGGKGNFSIERLGPENAMLDLQAGSGYIFGVDGINREVWHRTFPTSQDSFLPELTTKIDGKTYPAGSYRVTITMRRVMPLAQSMPQAPSIVSDITTSTAAPITITNNPAEYTNHSGGAYGGDTFWDIIGREFGVTKHMHYKDAGNANLSQKLRNAGVTATVLTKEQMDKARTEVERLLGENYPDTLQGNLQVRNYYQVANADAVFAVAEIAPTTSPKVFGGTNTAVQLAIKMNKPVYVFDLDTNKWYTQDLDFLANGYDSTKHNFDYNGWKEINTPALTKNFAGVGSRDIESYNVQKDGKWVPRTQYKGKEVEEAAKQAIRDVYANTFKSTQPSTSVVERTDKIVLRSELKANPTTLYLFGDNDIRKGLGGQAKEMRGESNAIGVSTKKLPARGEEAYKSDTELEKNKEIITNDINKAIAEWNTGKYNKLIIPQMGVGLAELPTRAPETYKFLQQELKRLEDQVTKPSTGVERNIKVDQYNIKIQPDGTMFYENGNEVTDETIQNKANIRKELQDGVLRTSDFNNSIYFVLSNNKILGSGKTNLGKESVQNASIKEQILAKAILYKKSCSS